MGRKWYLFSNWLVALIAVFYCHYFVVMVCLDWGGGLGTQLGFKFFAREGGKDRAFCYSYFALTMCLRYPALEED